MTAPNLSEFKKLARKGNLVALFETIPADLETPVSCFLKLAAKAPHAFLLESAEQEERIGRYSFIGLNPRLIVNAEKGRVLIRENRSERVFERPVLDVLKEQLAPFRLANAQSLPAFCGGFVGYLSYEMVQEFEQIRLSQKKGPSLPEAIFFLSQELLIFDHFRKTLSIVVLVSVDPAKKLERLYREAEKKVKAYLPQLQKPLPLGFEKGPHGRLQLQSNMSRRTFEKKVRRIKAYIKAGDCIQVVLSQRFSFQTKVDDFQIYRALRSINPSPYMFYFRSGKFRLIGSSPEMLVRKTGKVAELRPIAGTRPRGRTPEEDAALEENLKKSAKEMAEHLMLVDLGRNDLGRVCLFNSVKMKDFARVERYSHVMHLVSDVVGRLKPNQDAFDLLKATFPAGTVTGAPKIRAMQIIDELEEERRGAYAGCLGYISFNRDMDMCLTIRTLVDDGRRIYLQAGAGIVKDSSPQREYQETVNKAKALFKALEALQGHGRSHASGHR